MNDPKSSQSLLNLGNALQRLKEALLETEKSSLVIDGTIQRFEFVIELYWKTFKRLLSLEGVQTSTPRESLKEAYQAGWIHNEIAWLNMLRDRNATSQIYDETEAIKIYNRIKEYYTEMEATYAYLIDRYQ